MPKLRAIVWPILLGLLILLGAKPARAEEESCGAAAHEWAGRCSTAQRFSLEPGDCVGDRATFRATLPDGTSLVIEVRAHGQAFNAVPVGEYPDWNQVPAATREALEKVRRCVASGFDAGVLAPLPVPVRPGAPPPAPPQAPWRLVLAGLLALAVAAAIARGRRNARTAGVLVALAVGTFVFRRLAFPVAFFHQNGHGPEWIAMALGRPSPYGPGFHQLFSLLAARDPSAAERPVFVGVGLLAATTPPCVWCIARASGSRRVIAWSLAVLTALAPALGRLADSESYYGVCASLLVLSAAVLISGGRTGRARSLAFLLGVAAAGFLVAQAAFVQPVCWVPALLVPTVLLAGRGSWRRRLRLTLVAGVGIALVVVATAGSVLLGVAREQSRWGSTATSVVPYAIALAAGVIPYSLAMALAFASRRVRAVWRDRVLGGRIRRSMLHATALLVVIWALRSIGQMVDYLPIWIRYAWLALFLPEGIALPAAMLGRWLPRRRELQGASIVLVAGGMWAGLTWHAVTALPTDALEARFAGKWRDQLGNNATLTYVERAGEHVSTLPIYADRDPRRIDVSRISVTDVDFPRLIGDLSRAVRRASNEDRGDVLYYHSSVCSTGEGRAFCTELERRLDLEPIVRAEFPALPTMPELRYDSAMVGVALYRIRDVRSGSSGRR